MSAPDQAPPPYPGDADTKGGAAYPPAAGYPPQQPGYPPQQPGYPPQQAGYPPQPGSYQQPPQQPPPAGYPGQPPQQPYVQGGYPPQPPTQSTVIVSQPATTVTTVVQHFGDVPSNTKCPNCHNQVTTQVSHEPGTMAWLICILFFVFGLWCCCFIPFCVDSMQNANHHCPVCKYRIATYTR